MTLIAGVSEGPNYTTPKPPPERNIQPVIMFLTDGVPTAGEVRLTKLLKSVQFANQNLKASYIFWVTIRVDKFKPVVYFTG
jgi:hypothetical protein